MTTAGSVNDFVDLVWTAREVTAVIANVRLDHARAAAAGEL